jgi:phospholipid transport system substrate-binding protein
MTAVARRPLRAVLAALVVAFFLPYGTAQAEETFAGDAEKFIQSLANQAIEALTANDISRAERISRFRKLLDDNFAVDGIARFVLGPYWRRATDEERAEYLKLFEDFVVITYVNRFSEYTGETLQVTDTVMLDKNDALVKSRIVRPQGQPPVRVDWRVRSPNGGFKIVDVVVEGVSMSLTQRSEFASVIKRGGNRVSSLIEMLRERTAGLRPTSTAEGTTTASND